MYADLLALFIDHAPTLKYRTTHQQEWAQGYSYAAFVDGFARDIQYKVTQDYRFDANDSPKDRLFEIMMIYFDHLQDNRATVIAIINELKKHPTFFLTRRAAINATFDQMLGLAQLSNINPLSDILFHKGLKLTFLAGLRAWQSDDSADLSLTMKAIDQSLSRLSRTLAKLPPCSKGKS